MMQSLHESRNHSETTISTLPSTRLPEAASSALHTPLRELIQLFRRLFLELLGQFQDSLVFGPLLVKECWATDARGLTRQVQSVLSSPCRGPLCNLCAGRHAEALSIVSISGSTILELYLPIFATFTILNCSHFRGDGEPGRAPLPPSGHPNLRVRFDFAPCIP